MRSRLITLLVMVLALLALAPFSFAASAAAQSDTASPVVSGVGNCVAALGIGAEGDSCINVVHASPDAPAVDIAVTGGDVLIPNLAFPDGSDALVVPAGAYDLEVRAAGTTDVALPLPGVVFEPGMVYDIFAIGLVSDDSLTVLVVPSTTSSPAATPAA